VTLRIVTGSANHALALATAKGLGKELVTTELERFPDGELRPVVGAIRGDDVYVIQPTCPPVNEHLVELLLLLDACGRAGAQRTTAVVPYFGYARQDRRTRPGQAIGARVAAEMIAAAGADRLLVVDPHMPGFEAICRIPVEILTALPILADAFGVEAEQHVVVAPDLGAVKLAERFAARWRLPVAVVRKRRMSDISVRAEDLVGEVGGRKVVIVDDMITTAATIEAATGLLIAEGAEPNAIVVAIHGLFVSAAKDRLGRLDLARLLVTDTVPAPKTAPAVEVCSIAPLLVKALGRLHREEQLDDLGVFD